MEIDEENGIYIEQEEEQKDPYDARDLRDMLEYIPWDLPEFLFGDDKGCFEDWISMDQKFQLFDSFLAPLIRNY